MTNKVKPFYIHITDDMTPQMVQDAFDKCVDAGAIAFECVVNTSAKYDYKCDVDLQFGFFGVDYEVKTYLQNSLEYYGATAQEITLDQLDEWLGLDAEWKAGDMVTIKNPEGFGVWDEANKYLGSNGTVMAVFTNTNGKKVAAVSHDDSVCICWMLSMLSKPETPEQKAERERLEDGKSLFELAQKLWTEVQSDYEVYSYNSPMVCDNTKELYARLAEKVGYSKQKTDRNQLEVAYDLYIAGQESLAVKKQQSFQQFTSDKVQVKFWLAVADKAGYRKQ